MGQLTVMIDDEIHARLKSLAARERKSLRQVMGTMIKSYIDEQEHSMTVESKEDAVAKQSF